MLIKCCSMLLVSVFSVQAFGEVDAQVKDCAVNQSLGALEVMVNLDDRYLKGVEVISELEVKPNDEFIAKLDSLSISSTLTDVVNIVGEEYVKSPSNIKLLESYHWPNDIKASGVTGASMVYTNKNSCTFSFSFSWNNGPHIFTLLKRISPLEDAMEGSD